MHRSPPSSSTAISSILSSLSPSPYPLGLSSLGPNRSPYCSYPTFPHEPLPAHMNFSSSSFPPISNFDRVSSYDFDEFMALMSSAHMPYPYFSYYPYTSSLAASYSSSPSGSAENLSLRNQLDSS